MSVQALYIDPRGPYPKLLGPENCWDITRDARLYDGPYPVIAHPDCGPWGHLRHLCLRQMKDCALRAIEQVRPFPGREPTHWVSGGGSGQGKTPPGIKVCSAQQRLRTPLAFAEFLIAIARLAEKDKAQGLLDDRKNI